MTGLNLRGLTVFRPGAAGQGPLGNPMARESPAKAKVTSKKGQAKVAKVMREYEAGTLHHGSTGEVVKDPAVAKAIAMSEGRRAQRKKTR